MGLQNTFESIIPLSYVKGDCECSIMKYHNAVNCYRDRAEGGAGGTLAPPPLFCKNKNKLKKKII